MIENVSNEINKYYQIFDSTPLPLIGKQYISIKIVKPTLSFVFGLLTSNQKMNKSTYDNKDCICYHHFKKCFYFAGEAIKITTPKELSNDDIFKIYINYDLNIVKFKLNG
jgi:hypothetical protein